MTKLQSLSEIFKDKLFRIPDFQRGYSWGEKQLQDFWEDLENLSQDHFHYIGLLTVVKIEETSIRYSDSWADDIWLIDRNYSAFQIIDGQQRLTTMVIAVNEFLKTFEEEVQINYYTKDEWTRKFLYIPYSNNYKSFIFGYSFDDPSNEFFKTKILGQSSSSADKFPETIYTANLEFAKDFFARKIKGIDKYQRELFFSKLVNRFKFNYYEMDKDLDIHVTFETMNNRGKELSKLELLKNRLIYITTFLKEDASIKSRLTKDIIETWKTIYEHLGKNKHNPLDDDTFLANHWIMYFPNYNRKEAEAYAQFLLKEYFVAKNVINRNILFDDIKNYIDSLSEAVKVWYYINNPQNSPYSSDVMEWLEKLHRLGMGAFQPLIMAVLSKDNDEDGIVSFLRACETFCFLIFAVSRRQSNTRSNEILRLANSYFRNKEWTAMDISNHINWLIYGDEETMGWLNLDNFRNYIKEQFSRDAGFYSWNGLKYFLYEYEKDLQIESGDIKITWEEFNKRKKEETIEHIYPQTPSDEYWKKRFGLLTEKEHLQYLNSLGNLLLLSRSKNASLQNFDFDTKKCKKDKDGKERGYFNGSYSEIQVANNTEWTQEMIRNRGIELLKFMEEGWNINFSDWGITYDEILFPLNDNKVDHLD